MKNEPTSFSPPTPATTTTYVNLQRAREPRAKGTTRKDVPERAIQPKPSKRSQVNLVNPTGHAPLYNVKSRQHGMQDDLTQALTQISEIRRTMALLGVSTVKELGPQHVRLP